MKTKLSMLSALAISLAMLAGAIPARAAGRIVMEGSTTVLPIAQRTAEEYMAINKDADITVRGGGSGVGITSLLGKTCDIANSSRPIKDAELQKAAGLGAPVKGTVVAMDGIAIIAHPSNPLTGLTKKQVEDIFTGKITNWSKLGGSDAKIVAVSRDTASGTYEAFGALALNGKKVSPGALMQASNQAIAGTVARTPGAIGYIGHGYLSAAVKAVPIDGVEATRETILSGKYPFARPLYMYTRGTATGPAKAYLDFVLSPAGQKLVEQEGFVGLK